MLSMSRDIVAYQQHADSMITTSDLDVSLGINNHIQRTNFLSLLSSLPQVRLAALGIH